MTTTAIDACIYCKKLVEGNPTDKTDHALWSVATGDIREDQPVRVATTGETARLLARAHQACASREDFIRRALKISLQRATQKRQVEGQQP